MIKVVFSAGLIIALSGCLETIGQVREAILNPAPEVEMTVPRVNRAAIEAADLAAVLMLSPTIGLATVGVAVQMRDGRIVYNSNENRRVTLDGGLIYSTRGLGTNLQAVTTQSDDPLVTEAMPGSWPANVTRTYYLSARGTTYDTITATCSNQTGEEAVIDVADVQRQVMTVVESCTTGTGLTFNNAHFLDVRTGRIWRSSQWTGPDQGNIQIDVIEPFDM